MKLGLMLGYSGAEMSLPVELVQRAEALGFDSVWTAEAYGSDATSPLAYLAAVTKRIRLGTSIMQLAGRKREAIAAVPDDFCDEGALVGPPQRIRDRYKEWESSGATGLTLSCRRIEGLELMAELTGSRERH